jgi:hypothetical protein
MEPEQAPLVTAELLSDKDAFASKLAATFEPDDIVRMFLAMDLRYSDLALALKVHPRTVRAWIEEEDRDADRQRDRILTLKALVLFLLRRGVLSPRQVAMWLIEPQEALSFRRPLAVLADDGLDPIVSASAPFVRPEPTLQRTRPKAGAAVPARSSNRPEDFGGGHDRQGRPIASTPENAINNPRE